jgi:4-diphosphocytidyl-2-C-methyl-D-erythritol kinase
MTLRGAKVPGTARPHDGCIAERGRRSEEPNYPAPVRPHDGCIAERGSSGSRWPPPKARTAQMLVKAQRAPFEPFVLKARAKVNLRLEVGRRTNHLHDVLSVIVPLAIHDELTFEPAQDGFCVVMDLPGIDERENLVWRAARQLADPPPSVRVSVTKRIPVFAGLGGGSADAATALRGLARVLDRQGHSISEAVLVKAAAACGSDVPAALCGRLAIVGGTGESVIPYPCAAPPWGVVLLKPAVDGITSRAYEWLDEAAVPHPLGERAVQRAQTVCRALADHDFQATMRLLHNDFDAVVSRRLPEVADAHRRLRAAGATATLLCGSGSCVAGFFATLSQASAARARLTLRPGEWAAVTELRP